MANHKVAQNFVSFVHFYFLLLNIHTNLLSKHHRESSRQSTPASSRPATPASSRPATPATFETSSSNSSTLISERRKKSSLVHSVTRHPASSMSGDGTNRDSIHCLIWFEWFHQAGNGMPSWSAMASKCSKTTSMLHFLRILRRACINQFDGPTPSATLQESTVV